MAQRVYENEINMLIRAIELADVVHTVYIPVDEKIFKRMPEEYEKQLMEIFQNRKELFFKI